MKHLVGETMRWSATSLILSPVLIFTRFGPSWLADGAIVLLVALAVVFFSLLNLFVLVHWLAWRERQRVGENWELCPPFSSSRKEKAREARGEGHKTVQTFRGIVRWQEQSSQQDSAVVDRWWTSMRITEIEPFVVECENGDLLRFDFGIPPLLFTKPVAVRDLKLPSLDFLPSEAPRIPSHRPTLAMLRQGDDVEVRGVVKQTLYVDAATQNSALPYRNATRYKCIVIDST
ncbi:MAG TPA: hypothetical protein PKW66_20380 [Polyangiaceae bacterium]|nr:hypothetical protein [Polyangiaceae bacterium]